MTILGIIGLSTLLTVWTMVSMYYKGEIEDVQTLSLISTWLWTFLIGEAFIFLAVFMLVAGDSWNNMTIIGDQGFAYVVALIVAMVCVPVLHYLGLFIGASVRWVLFREF